MLAIFFAAWRPTNLGEELKVYDKAESRGLLRREKEKSSSTATYLNLRPPYPAEFVYKPYQVTQFQNSRNLTVEEAKQRNVWIFSLFYGPFHLLCWFCVREFQIIDPSCSYMVRSSTREWEHMVIVLNPKLFARRHNSSWLNLIGPVNFQGVPGPLC